MIWFQLLCFVCLCLTLVECEPEPTEDQDPSKLPQNNEARLYHLLMENYDFENQDRAVRPVGNPSDTLHVKFGVALIQFLKYDEDTNIATFMTWERYLWKDTLLKWNPEDVGGIDQIRIPIEKIWKPDIILYNGFEDPDVASVLAVATSDGTVLYIPRVPRKVLCDTDSDFITCRMKFGSWTYDGFKIDVDFYDGLEQVDVNDYVRNNDYTLVSHAAKKNIKYYPCCAEPYIDLTFTLEFAEGGYSSGSGIPTLQCIVVKAYIFVAFMHLYENYIY